MTFRRLAAIGLIFLGTSVAWAILGSSLVARTGQFDGRLGEEVRRLWGGPHRQLAPGAAILRQDVEQETVDTRQPDGSTVRTQVTKPVVRTTPAALESTRAVVRLDLDHRRRGLLWYSTYVVDFQGTYTFRNPDAVSRTLRVSVPLPAQDVLYDDFAFTIDGQPVALSGEIAKEVVGTAQVAPGAIARAEVRYRSRGLDTWIYAFDKGVAQVRDFSLEMHTNFLQVDYPAGTVSPGATRRETGGWVLTWTFANLISGQNIGMQLPERLNPGPFAARVTFFAPVSLLFFLAVMVMLGAMSGPSLHPMHYWFLSAAFFAFHLLLAYLVDHISVHVAFLIAAAVSLGLVVSYLRVVIGMRHAVWRAGAAQVVFLVLFSYAFFFEGVTGLTITIGAIVTLFTLMQATAGVSWDDVFAGTSAGAASRGTEAADGIRR